VVVAPGLDPVASGRSMHTTANSSILRRPCFLDRPVSILFLNQVSQDHSVKTSMQLATNETLAKPSQALKQNHILSSIFVIAHG